MRSFFLQDSLHHLTRHTLLSSHPVAALKCAKLEQHGMKCQTISVFSNINEGFASCLESRRINQEGKHSLDGSAKIKHFTLARHRRMCRSRNARPLTRVVASKIENQNHHMFYYRNSKSKNKDFGDYELLLLP